MHISEQADSVHDMKSLVQFMNALRRDFTSNKDEWENRSIDAYLESIAAWIEDYSKVDNPDVDLKNPDWRSIAAIFYMGKIYE